MSAASVVRFRAARISTKPTPAAKLLHHRVHHARLIATVAIAYSVTTAALAAPPSLEATPIPIATETPRAVGPTPVQIPSGLPVRRPASIKDRELRALEKAGIPPSDVRRAHDFLEQEHLKTRAPRHAFQKLTVTAPPVVEIRPERSPNRAFADALFAQRSAPGTAGVGTLPNAPASVNTAVPAVVRPSIVIIRDLFSPDGELQAGTTVVISGRSLQIGGTPTVTLELPGCGSFPVAVVRANDTNIEATIPTVVGNALRMSGALVVHSGPFDGQPIPLTYVPPLQDIFANINVSAPLNTAGGHAGSDGGIGLVEGQTMITSPGQDRESCCSSTYGGRGGDGEDTFMPRVQLLNGYKIIDFDAEDDCQYKDFRCTFIVEAPSPRKAGPIHKRSTHRCYDFEEYCNLVNVPSSRTQVAPSDAIALSQAPGTANAETVMDWRYNAGSEVAYTIMYEIVGPLGARAFPWESGVPVHGQATCAR